MEPEIAKKIWSELIEEVKSLTVSRSPDEITIDEFSKEAGIDKNTAREFLENKVRQGSLKKRKLYLREVGSMTNLYSPTE